MNKLTLDTLGERLRKVRIDLGLSQTQLAEQLNVGQMEVSRLETGKGGGINFLLSVICFYSPHIRIEILLNPNIDFSLINRNNQLYKKPINEIAIERINQLKEDLDNIVKLLK